MRYVQRDSGGNLIGHYANPQPYAQEEVADDHPDILAWRAAQKAAREESNARRAELQLLISERRKRP